MKTVIIISKCLRQSGDWHEFHFTGVFAGDSIQKVLLLNADTFAAKVGEEYLIYVQILSFEDGVLRGRILRMRPLNECCDLS
jgi:hypothetical protein